MTNSFIIHSKFLNVILDGLPYMMDDSNPNFSACIKAIKEKSWNLVKQLVSKEVAINNLGNDLVKVKNGAIYYRDEEIHSVMTQKMLTLLDEGHNIDPMIKFLENLMANPSASAIMELYDFLKVGNLPLTEDGCFLAYKRVRGNWKDIHSNSFDNTIGRKLEMPRSDVNPNRNEVCSRGFHFCSFDYLLQFSSNDSSTDKILIVKINPKDVVSIPSDYNQTKGRTCKYEVFAEYLSGSDTLIPAFESSLIITAPYKKAKVSSKSKSKVSKNKLEKVVKSKKKEKVKSGPARDSHGRFISKKK
jgi:hypothetical protein